MILFKSLKRFFGNKALSKNYDDEHFLRCTNCGWLNEVKTNYCIKCNTPIDPNAIISFIGSNGGKRVHFPQNINYSIQQNTYTVWSLYGIRYYKLNEFMHKKVTIRKNAVKKHILSKLMAHIDKNHKENSTFTYLCPICGSNIIVEEAPMQFGDDYICRCSKCHNRFIFGGTRPIGFKFTSLTDLNPNPYELAYSSMLVRCEMLAQKEQKTISQQEDLILMMKDCGKKFQITDLAKLY